MHTSCSWMASLFLRGDIIAHLHACHTPPLALFGSSSAEACGEQLLQGSGGPLFLRRDFKRI